MALAGGHPPHQAKLAAPAPTDRRRLTWGTKPMTRWYRSSLSGCPFTKMAPVWMPYACALPANVLSKVVLPAPAPAKHSMPHNHDEAVVESKTGWADWGVHPCPHARTAQMEARAPHSRTSLPASA